MLVVSVSDFNNNLRTYNKPVLIEENGVNIGKFIPAKTRFFHACSKEKMTPLMEFTDPQDG